MSSEHDTENQDLSAQQNDQEPVQQELEEAPETSSGDTEAEATHEGAGDTPALFGEMTLSTAEAAQWLRLVADAVESGQLVGEKDPLKMPERLSYKLELEEEMEDSVSSLEYEIEVEIEWNPEA